MSLSLRLGRALPVAALALAIAATPALAFGPSVLVRSGGPGVDLVLTDLATRGDVVAASATYAAGSIRAVTLDQSSDGGATWGQALVSSGYAVREPRTTICAGNVVMIYRFDVDHPATQWVVESLAVDLGVSGTASVQWMSNGVYRGPDVACVANHHLVGAMFRKTNGHWHVHVMTSGGRSLGSHQAFDLGSGTPGRGLSIATSSSRVYVTWFDGSKLKLRRFSIGSSSDHDLTSLGTSTLATLPSGVSPQIGADGDRVILAYMDKASLKVRRSNTKGVSFRVATTLRFEGYPGEIGAYPLTVVVKGAKVAIGAVEISDGGGKGLGYLSANGGASYAKVSQHSSGRVVAGLVKVGSSYRYAEAYDQSISQPDPQSIRFRRE